MAMTRDNPIDAMGHAEDERCRLEEQPATYASTRQPRTEAVRRLGAEPVGHEAVGSAAAVVGARSTGPTHDRHPIRRRNTMTSPPRGDRHRPPSRTAVLLFLAVFVLGLLLQVSVVFV